ncbi:MAG: HAMP domain-containing protein [Deltaproteobacteria bacterium]|nr:HAMP domain-containing protein [Deltaproteobacteria bacterium]
MSGFWTLRRRILASIVALLLLTVGSTLWVLYGKLQDAAARGDYLAKHFERYLKYQEVHLGVLTLDARILAADRGLAEALDAADPAKIESARRRLLREVDATHAVDFIALYDRYASPAPGFVVPGPLEGGRRLLAAAADGKVVSEVALLGDQRAWLVAAAPVRLDERQVGLLVLGRPLFRTFEAYSAHSDEKKEKRHQLSLLVDGQVVSSTAPEGDWKELAAALAARFKVREGSLAVTVVTLGGTNFDMSAREFPFTSSEGKPLDGEMVLSRVRESYESRVTDNLLPVVYVGVGGVLAAIILAFLLSGTITRPIRSFTASIRQIVSGEADLTHRLEVKGHDELAELATAINELAEKVSSLVWRIRDSSLRLGQSAQEISHVSMRTLEGARGQVGRVENSTSLSNELSRTIQEIAARANQGAQIAGQGRESVEKTDSGMARIRETVHGSWDKVRNLKGNVEKIGAIAELISKITEENSMLALNASIEAARAGSAGQGFAVVAQQMREQARRVEKSSREIIDNIRSIQAVTQELVSSMDGSKSDVERGSQLVNITLHHLSELSSIMQETAESVKEQAAASDDIAQLMVEVQRIAHEALEASQQTVDEGSRIRDKAQELALLVGRFKVGELAGDISPTRQLPPGEPAKPNA